VLFSSFTEPIKMLEAHFGNRCVVVNGEVPPVKRNEYEKKFKEDDKCVVFIGQYAAAGVGINLTNASNMIMCNFPWTWAELEQAEDRQHRIGQGKSVNIFYTVCKKSVDERVYGLVKSKMKDAVKAIDNKDAELETRTVSSETIFDVIEDMLAEHDITLEIEKTFN
jgi:SWI/SNF-related matrix-associated actin-dependent regulator of chromatin subfamily A-like protein 1